MEPAWLGSRSRRVGFSAALAASSASGLWPFRGMACGATLKRPMEFEAALLSPGSPKRRRCAPLPGPTPGLRPPDAEPPPLQMQTPTASLQQPAPPGSERRLPTPGNLRCCCGLGRKPGRGGEGAGVVDAGRDYLGTPYRPWEKKELGCCWARLLPGTRDIREGQWPHSVGFRVSWSWRVWGVGTKMRWGYSKPPKALGVPEAPPASACAEPPRRSSGPWEIGFCSRTQP